MDKQPLDYSKLNISSKFQRQEDEPHPYPEAAAQHSSEKQLYNDEFLCDDCRAVDWSSLPALAADGLLETRNLALRTVSATVEKLRNSSCRICVILSTIKGPVVDRERGVLTALSLSRQRGFDGDRLPRDSASRCAVLSIVWPKTSPRFVHEKLSLAVTRIDELGARAIAPTSVDYSKFKDLLEICEKEHKVCCAIEPHPNVLGLEVIDIKTQKVVKAPDGCQYSALSYVWGKDSGSSSDRNIRNSPPVIRDAISVTNSMGYRYLWVDRYCISDSKEKPRMISQMDQIYANASLTIIAAADGDTEMGLCGVSMPRQLQRKVNIQDIALLELPRPEDLKYSKWASRGWTYQECYLSRRRLIFTKTQVLFLCNAMYATESLQRLLGTNCFSDETGYFNALIPLFEHTKFRSPAAKDLLEQVQEYCKRELTYPSDSLNAILGVLSYSAKTSANLISPLLQLPWGLIAETHAVKSFGLHFFWYHEKQLPTRRTDFPSWSWTGWGGPLQFADCLEVILEPEDNVMRESLSYLDCHLYMRDADGNTLEMYDIAWKEFKARRSNDRLYQPGSKQLLVSCLVTRVRFQEPRLPKYPMEDDTEISIEDTGARASLSRPWFQGALPTLQIWKGIYVALGRGSLYMDQRIENQDHILGLISTIRPRNLNESCCLLVRQVGEGLYERIGLLRLHGLLDWGFWRRKTGVYVDAVGSVLEEFTISDTQRRHPFADTAERRTICLV